MLKKQILFIKPSLSSFIEQDEEIFRKHFRSVITINYSYTQHFRSQINLLILLLRWVPSSNLIYIWFASYHSVLPTLVAKIVSIPCIIVIGGHDAAKVYELNYGAHLKPFRSWCSIQSCKFATMLLTVSQFTHKSIFRFIGNSQRKKTHLVYNAIDTNIFRPNPRVKRLNRVVTVCGTNKEKVIFRKSIDFFLEIAEKLPNVEFMVVGLEGPAMKWCQNHNPPNVLITERVDRDTLTQILNESKVICQFSRYEAFGLALAEGMSMGCIPVGYNYGGTPEIMINLGYLIDKLDIELGVDAIMKALQTPDRSRKIIRDCINKRFSYKKREKKLISLINNLW